MKKLIEVFVFLFVVFSTSFSQYNANSFVFSAGLNYSKYCGQGEGTNYFTNEKPGVQFELTFNDYNSFEWIIYGLSYHESQNIVELSEVPVKFWVPYYTEFLFYQADKRNPLFLFFGYDYARMKFPQGKKPDNQHYLSFGGGWNLMVADNLALQFKFKPYFIIDNSVGQWFGFNAMLNIHIGMFD
jgi:hypothetical protein